MSVTILSNADNSRSFWMIPFEGFFGICIKYVNPFVFLYMMCENLSLDLSIPYGSDSSRLQTLSSIFVFLTALLIFGPMFACDYPERFTYDVNLEFNADHVYAMKLKGQAVTGVQAFGSN